MSTQFLPVAVTLVTAVQLGQRKMSMVYWFNPASVGDTVVLQDDKGNGIWSGRCEVQNQSQALRFPTPFDVAGFQVPTIASGTLFIYA